MNKFAQVIPQDVNNFLCPDFSDQNIILSTVWFIMLLTCLVLAIGLFALHQRKYSLVFLIFTVILVAIKLLNPTNECGNGGLFASSDSTFITFGIFILAILVTAVLATISIAKSRKLKAKEQQS